MDKEDLKYIDAGVLGCSESELTEEVDSKKLEAHLMNYIDKRKGNKIKESVDNKNFTFPDLRRAIDFFWQDRDAKIETVPIKKLVDDNNLLNDDDLQSYHQRQWNNKKASEFSIDKSKVNSMRISEVPYAVRKKDGKLELGDGRHRTRALYNDGYEYVTLPVINETLDLSGKISTTINSSKKNDKLINRKRINENTSNIPTKKGKAYKVFKVKNGKLYPPMVANSGGKDTPIGVWLDAEEGEFAGLSKTGRPQVKRANKSGVLAYRPGWHLGDIPRAKQFDRLNKETGEYEFPKDFVWAECEYAMDIDYQPEADEQGYMRTKVGDDGNVTTYKSDKYQHSLAGLKKLPTKGYYKYRTNPDPNTVPWVITGQMKVNKLLDDFEVNEILKQNGIEPIHRQGGDKTLKELGLKEITVNESKTTPRIRESLLQEGKQDKENFRKWAEQAVEIAYKDRGLSDLERKGNAEYIVNWFENNRKNLRSPQNDYYYWIKEKNVQGAYDELNRLAVEQEKKKDSEKKSKDGARLIYSDSNWKVYEITTYEASVKYGANTKWCISGSKRWSNGANGRGYWNDYTSKGVKFYFFIGKDTKYAIAIYPNGTDFEIFDAQDNSIAYIPNAPIIDEIKVDYYSHNEDRLMLNLIKTGQLPHVCSLLSQYLWEISGYSINIYDKSEFDNFLQQIAEGVDEDYVKWLAVYNGLKDEEWYENETGEKYEDEWYGDTTWYLQNDLGFLDNYATLEDALTKDNPYFNYDNNEYFISDLYDEDTDCCKEWVAVWLYLRRYLKDETDLLNSIKDEISTNWGYSDFEKVGLSKEYLQGENDLDESLDDFEDEVGKVYHGGIEKSLHKDFKSILWFTEDYDYALDFGENIFICNLNLKNTLIVGNTDGYIRGLIPTQFSTDFTRLANNLRVTPKELLKCNPEASKIYSIVRTKAFKDLCIKNGYDSVETEEFGHVCFGVFNLDQVDIVDTDFEDESTLETLSPMDESLKPRVREELLLEKGTDYKKQAVKIISNSGLFDEETSTKIIDGLFRQDIHAFNHAPAWLEKYLKGIARMLVQYCDGDKSKAQQFLTECPSEFEYYLTWVKQNREKIGNSLDDEFVNNLTYEQVKEKNNKIRDEIDAKSKDELSKMKFSNSSDYTLVPIDSYEQMHKLYGGHWTGDGTDEEGEYAGHGGTSWCHTNSKNTYANWTKGGHRFFVLQHNNWKDIPFNEKTNKEMSGKDDYGNSLIAILVNKYGKLNNATLRCNHVGVSSSADNQYNSYAELSKIAGFNVEEEVLKYDFEEFSTDKLFTIYDGSLIRASDNTEIYNDIVEYKIPIGVKNISFSTFENCIHLTSIEIPPSVTEIGHYAFANCSNLKSITFQEGSKLTIIHSGAFYGCSKLTSITIPDSVESIDDAAFSECSRLTNIVIPSSITSIAPSTFYDCISLTSITLPSSVTSIGNYAFRDCRNLTNIEIPANVTSIGENTFYNCSSLTSVTFAEGSKLTHIDTAAFKSCSSLTSITIPEGVTNIGNITFYKCRNLTSIEIPTSVTSIGYSNFDDCSPNLTVFTDNEYVIRYCNKDNIKCAPLSEYHKS